MKKLRMLLVKLTLWILNCKAKKMIPRITEEQSLGVVEKHFSDEQLMAMFKEREPDGEIDIDELKSTVAQMVQAFVDISHLKLKEK